jgi:hypothetical protein
MIVLGKSKRILIERVQIKRKYIQFEVSLPSNLSKITGVYITTNAKDPGPTKLGKVAFQMLDESDLFLTAEIFTESNFQSDESIAQVDQIDFDGDKVWISGNVPKKIPLLQEGNAGSLQGWYLCHNLISVPYTLNLFIEYEETAELLEEKE